MQNTSSMTDYVRRCILRYPHSTLTPQNPCLRTGASQLTASALTAPQKGPQHHCCIAQASPQHFRGQSAQGTGMLEIFFQTNNFFSSSLRSPLQPQIPVYPSLYTSICPEQYEPLQLLPCLMGTPAYLSTASSQTLSFISAPMRV